MKSLGKRANPPPGTYRVGSKVNVTRLSGAEDLPRDNQTATLDTWELLAGRRSDTSVTRSAG